MPLRRLRSGEGRRRVGTPAARRRSAPSRRWPSPMAPQRPLRPTARQPPRETAELRGRCRIRGHDRPGRNVGVVVEGVTGERDGSRDTRKPAADDPPRRRTRDREQVRAALLHEGAVRELRAVARVTRAAHRGQLRRLHPHSRSRAIDAGPCSAGAGGTPGPGGAVVMASGLYALMSRLRKATLDGKLWTCRARNPEGRRSLVKSLISCPLRVTRIRVPAASIR
jgi:hypothetical protein